MLFYTNLHFAFNGLLWHNFSLYSKKDEAKKEISMVGSAAAAYSDGCL
jgi:hypothetical protein